MSQSGESSDYTGDQSLVSFSEQDETPISIVAQEVVISSALVSDLLEEAPAIESSSTPQGSQSIWVSSSASLNRSDESFSNQDEKNPSTLMPMLDANNLPACLDEKMTLLVQFMLTKYQQGEVITKEDILKVVSREYEDHFPELLTMASKRMELVFGIKVREEDPINHCYVLCNNLGLTYNKMLSGEETLPKNGLLIFILGVLFMKGNRAPEKEIWKVLNRMGIYSRKNHIIYGEPRKFITRDLVMETYLEYRRIPNRHPVSYEFLWGPRAHAEINKVKFLEYLARVNDSDTPFYSSQYEAALRDEEEKAKISPRFTPHKAKKPSKGAPRKSSTNSKE
ncbi:melanoma-associated antigen B16-like [Echinops telfairi]|uniref:Melanoma-associated antigen B16-like n=1 Tax=Echinops telfairi TaxID=9371 RepID=A0ABM0J9H3_ECHTE|nr:melanoma-associated antigen B16-like [Echinops telfairi]